MPELKVATSFYPLRLMAFTKSEVELTFEITNESNETYWTECSVQVPSVLSLVPDKDLATGKKRIGLIAPGETATGKCKIYSTARTYPDVHEIKITTFGYSRDGAVGARDDRKADLRCERINIQ
jgi:hypothetical protein